MSDQEALKKLLDSEEVQQQIRIAINQIVNQHVSTSLSQTDIDTAVDRHLAKRIRFNKDTVLDSFPGIQDSSTKPELTILPDNVVIESTLIAKNIEAMETAKLENLEVNGELKFNGDSLVSTGNNSKLLDYITKSITAGIDQTVISGITDSVKNSITNEVITKARLEYSKTVKDIVEQEIPLLLNTVEVEQKIDTLSSQIINQLVNRTVESTDIANLVKQNVDRAVRINRESLKTSFPGIDDNADSVELTLLPDTVVAENSLVAKNLEIIEHAKVQDLEIAGNILFNGNAFVNRGDNRALIEEITRSLTAGLDKKILDSISTEVKEKINQRVLEKGQLEFSATIRDVVEQELPSFLAGNGVDTKVDALLPQILNQSIERTIKSVDVPKLVNQAVTRTMTLNKSQLNKMYPGIEDQSEEVSLTLMPGVVVNENDFVSKNIEVVGDLSAKTATVNSLTVLDNLNVQGVAWDGITEQITNAVKIRVEDEWQDTVTDKVTAQIAKTGININNAIIDGQPLINNGRLHDTVVETAPLRKLEVNGTANINNVTITKTRLGVGTNNPERSLSVWDEEVSVVIGKHKANTAFVGTNRDQELQIGTNNKGQLIVKQDGTVSVPKLVVGKNQIGHTGTVPNWSGTKGDIMFNSNPGPDQPFIWICLGAYRWQGFGE